MPGAALPVPGARADLVRLAALIQRAGARFSTIHVTLDTHNPMDIAHPAWWLNADGQAPAPFTLISEQDLLQGVWRTRAPAAQQGSLAYVRALEATGRYRLVVWPEHCLFGSWGHAVEPQLLSALHQWSRGQGKPVRLMMKGMNPATEHYSAIRAEVPDASDPHTVPDPAWIAELRAAEQILIAGEALSHCVAATVRDLVAELGDAHIGKLVLLTDCTSPVAGFEALAEAFVTEMTARGMRLANSEEV